MNAPLGLCDKGGDVVTAVSESEKRMVKGSVAQCQYDIVQFDNNNQVMVAPIEEYLNSSSASGAPTENLQALLTAAKSETNVVIHDATKFEYIDANGQPKEGTLKTMDASGSTVFGSPEPNAIGMTIVPDPGTSLKSGMPDVAKMFSTDENVHVYVSKKNNTGKSTPGTVGHEIRGHVATFLQAITSGSGSWWHNSAHVNSESKAGENQAKEECGP
jgi:hypothetical protein